MKNRLEIINENLPLIPKDISIDEQIKMAEKKLRFMKLRPELFISTGEYIMTLLSVKKEIAVLTGSEVKHG